jgi:hypothetical protein
MSASLGPYRIEGKLGEGGMGDVYRAVDTRLGRAVAIKIAQPQFVQRFAREAYADLLALWKDADPDSPVVRQATVEGAGLH